MEEKLGGWESMGEEREEKTMAEEKKESLQSNHAGLSISFSPRVTALFSNHFQWGG